jgi:ATP-dependent DNA ligase
MIISTEIEPITFPARPINGGPFRSALLQRYSAGWSAECKWNGYRTAVHIESGAMFNRHGEPLSIAHEFQPALDKLRVTLDALAFKWADCEALERRHGIGRGSLIVLDVIPEPEFADAPYLERRAWLESVLPIYDLNPDSLEPDSIGLTPNDLILPYAWDDMQRINHRLGCQFYEGIVMKKNRSIYPIQLRSPKQTFPFWIKHRWAF